MVSLIVECALECEWADGAQTTLTGTANTDVDSLRDLLDEIMGTEVVELRMPDRVYAFERCEVWRKRALRPLARARRQARSLTRRWPLARTSTVRRRRRHRCYHRHGYRTWSVQHRHRRRRRRRRRHRRR